MVIGDHNLGFAHVPHHIAGQEITGGVVAVRVIGLKDSQAIADRNPWRDKQKATGKSVAAGMPYRIHRLPGNDHSHHCGLARSRRQFERDSP